MSDQLPIPVDPDSTEPEAEEQAESGAEAAGGEAVADGEGKPKSKAFPVSVGEFEGPLDLLLHLVRINEVDITNIPIVPITDQYNEHLDLMRIMNLEIAGEYLVMAATLMHIKSRMLLPPDPEAEDEEGENDPRAELAQQLLEYQKFKQVAENLSAMDSRRSLIWTRDGIPAEFEGEELLAVDLFDLLKAFRGLLGRLGDDARRQLKRDNVSVADKISWLTDLLERRPSIDLLELIEDLSTRLDRIATFLAVLEMVKLKMIIVFQRKIRGDIRIASAPDAPDEELPEFPPEDSLAESPADLPESQAPSSTDDVSPSS